MTIESTKVAPQSAKKVEPSINPITDVEKVVTSEVMKRLGKPSVDWKITANNVFDDKWRVNVWVNSNKPDAIMKQMLIKHSYFVTASPEGEIVAVDIEIEKCYE